MKLVDCAAYSRILCARLLDAPRVTFTCFHCSCCRHCCGCQYDPCWGVVSACVLRWGCVLDSVLVAAAAAWLCPLHMCSLCVPSAQDTFPLTCATHTEIERERECVCKCERACGTTIRRKCWPRDSLSCCRRSLGTCYAGMVILLVLKHSSFIVLVIAVAAHTRTLQLGT